jgi:TPR repeat protein
VTLFCQYLHIERNLSLSADYFKATADQDSIDGQIESVDFFVKGDDLLRDVRKSERYLRLAVDQKDVMG